MLRGTFHSALCCSCVMDSEMFLAHEADGWVFACLLRLDEILDANRVTFGDAMRNLDKEYTSFVTQSLPPLQ